MATESGEYIVGAYLQHCYECDIVLYNERQRGGKLAGLSELDVVGLNLPKREVYLCEVTTHILGMLMVNVPTTIEKVRKKFEAQKAYASARFNGFTTHYMLWSPVVSNKKLLSALKNIEGLELIVNGGFKQRVSMLRDIARENTHDMGNPFMRTLQILEHLRDD
jgi:hypothetical protein